MHRQAIVVSIVRVRVKWHPHGHEQIDDVQILKSFLTKTIFYLNLYLIDWTKTYFTFISRSRF